MAIRTGWTQRAVVKLLRIWRRLATQMVDSTLFLGLDIMARCYHCSLASNSDYDKLVYLDNPSATDKVILKELERIAHR